MKLWLRNLLLLVLMLAASGMAVALRPTHKIAEQGPKVDLEAMIPHAFADWREEKQNSAQIVDPSQLETINRIYSKTLSRTYVNTKGERIMLSIAYGEDQRDGMQTHYPEVCYPAQGFQVTSKRSGVLELPGGKLPLKLLETSLGAQRNEPVTYWTMIGDVAVLEGTAKKLAEMRYGLRGEIPDGLLFRVSSIDQNSSRAFKTHESFVTEILGAMPSPIRKKFSGTE
jgi:EpsI family protein